MDHSAVVWGLISLFTNFVARPSLDEEIRKLRGKTKYFSAKIEDLETGQSQMKTERGKKRKRDDDDDDLCKSIAKGHRLIAEAESLLGGLEEGSPEQKRQARGERGFFRLEMHANISALQRSSRIMAAHEKEFDMLLRRNVPEGQGDDGPLFCGSIPVKELFGQVASATMAELQALLLDHKFTRIAIQGAAGLGKTALMKHLYNYAVKTAERFRYVFWVTCPTQLSITLVQDAVAEAIGCDLSNISDSILRARKLSETLVALGNYVLFLDAVPETTFSLEQIGIPVPFKGDFCKLVITTRSNLVSGLLECSAVVQVNSLTEEEAFQLFMHEAGIDTGHVYLLDNIPRLVARKCGGVPSVITDTANQMRRIYDICEWRSMLFELDNHAILR